MSRIVNRRTFLKASGVALGLPALDAMQPRLARAARAAASPRRFIAVCGVLGFHPAYFFPKATGENHGGSPYLALLKDHWKEMTVLSGLSHPDHGGAGHASGDTWLTGARSPGRPGFRNGVSLDQYIAAELGRQTRFPSLNLSGNGGSSVLSWTATGVQVPAEGKPSQVFARLFLAGTPAEVARETERLAEGRSVLDAVGDQAKLLTRRVGPADRYKLDEYFTSVREAERQLHLAEDWVKKPKPVVSVKPPRDIANEADLTGRSDLMYDLMALALQTDSTRIVTFMLPYGGAVPAIPGVTEGYHNLSHHGQDESKIAMLRLIEEAQLRSLAGFLTKLKAKQEGGGRLLDSTALLFGSNLGNANAHTTSDLPIVVAGGGFKHAGHVAAGGPKDNVPLCNLYVALARHMGVETDKFGSSTKAGITGFDAK